MQIVSTTPNEEATRIVDAYIPKHIIAIDRHRLGEEIRRAIVNGATEEVTRRRAAENMLDSCKGGVMVVCTEEGTMLRAWNPRTKRWYETHLMERLP